MVSSGPVRLILFSGLAADSNVFAPQKVAFPQLIVPRWPKPFPNDTIDTYCDRLAEELRSDVPTIIGGASFGGIIALHAAERLDPLAVLLIGSVRAPSELSRLARFVRPLKSFVRFLPVRAVQTSCAPLASKLARRFAPHLGGLATQFYGCDPTVFKWSLARILDWSSTPNVKCPVFQIHGDRDLVLPMRHTHPDTVIAGGGHVISLTYPAEVIDFIRSAIIQAADES